VRSAVRNAGTAESVAYDPPDGVNTYWLVVRGQGTYEQRSVAGQWSFTLDVDLQRFARDGR
jgi:hypothetical protein